MVISFGSIPPTSERMRVRSRSSTLYPDDKGYIFQEWGEQIAGECDCMVFWMGQFVPFHTDCFVEVIGCVEDRAV